MSFGWGGQHLSAGFTFSFEEEHEDEEDEEDV